MMYDDPILIIAIAFIAGYIFRGLLDGKGVVANDTHLHPNMGPHRTHRAAGDGRIFAMGLLSRSD